MNKEKHKWWHFVYKRVFKSELVSRLENCETDNCWYECGKCGKQLTEKQGYTTFSISLNISN